MNRPGAVAPPRQSADARRRRAPKGRRRPGAVALPRQSADARKCARRTGAALVLCLLVVLVLEGVVLGTVYLTTQERRIADNGATALRLRLAADDAVRRAAAVWPPQLDSLGLGQLSSATAARTADRLDLRSLYQRIDSSLFLAFAEAAEPPPRLGRARTALLLVPPLLAAELLPHAALTAGAGVQLRAGAVLNSRSAPPCADDSTRAPDAVVLPDTTLLIRAGTAVLDGTSAQAPFAAEWRSRIAAVAAATPTLASPNAGAAFVYADSAGVGVLAVDGDLVVAPTVTFGGVILVTGSLLVEAGAVIDGIVLAGGQVDVAGTIRLSHCAAHLAIRNARLHLPHVLPGRSVVPAF